MWVTAGEVAARVRGGRVETLFGALAEAGVRYALLDRTEEVVSSGQMAEVLDFLVHRDDDGTFSGCVRHAGLHRRAGGARGRRVHDDGAVPSVVVRCRTELLYGLGEPCLATTAREDLILKRARTVEGARRLAEADELMHLVLSCLLDREAFTVRDRDRLTSLVEALRRDPVAAGRAAERVQAELAPVLPWPVLLSHVLHGRWTELLDHAPALRRRLVLQAPGSTAGRWLAGWWGRLRDSNDPVAEELEVDAAVDSDPVLVGADAEPATHVGAEAAAESGPEAGGKGGPKVGPEAGAPEELSHSQIRGSGLLLAGRGLSTGLKFLAELLIVRYLTTAEYGSWTYALAAVAFLRVIATLGLNRAVVRFLPIHLERGERGEFFGVIGFVLGALLLSTGATVAAFYAFPDLVARLAGAAPGERLDVLFIVILLVPVDTLDDFLTGICAAFSSSGTIFVRRYLLSPGLRILVALTLIAFRADVRMLAYGYLLAGFAGLLYYGWSVYQEIRDRGLLAGGALAKTTLPIGRVLAYTVPVMAADWCQILLTTIGPLTLGYFGGMSSVAMYRVVIPLVTLIQLVRQTFMVLFEPAASRLDARGDHDGLETFYWRAALWVAVLTFPAFAVSFAVAEPMTVLLFGERYRAAAPILSYLAMGAFVESLVGFNAPTLRVLGKLRWLISVNVAAALASVGLHLVLVRGWGATGAGIATGLSWALYALLAQAALWRGTGVTPFDTRYARPYVTILGCTIMLAAMRIAFPHDTVLLSLAVVASIVMVLSSARACLSITETFPELARFRIVRRVLR